MDESQEAERIDRLIREGLEGRTPRHIRTDKGVSLEGEAQAEYFADIRRSFDTYAGSRVLEVGKNRDAALLYKELFELPKTT